MPNILVLATLSLVLFHSTSSYLYYDITSLGFVSGLKIGFCPSRRHTSLGLQSPCLWLSIPRLGTQTHSPNDLDTLCMLHEIYCSASQALHSNVPSACVSSSPARCLVAQHLSWQQLVRCRTSQLHRRYFPRAARAWNVLPTEICSVETRPA